MQKKDENNVIWMKGGGGGGDGGRIQIGKKNCCRYFDTLRSCPELRRARVSEFCTDERRIVSKSEGKRNSIPGSSNFMLNCIETERTIQ